MRPCPSALVAFCRKLRSARREAVYRVHLRGTFAVTRAAWPLMREQGFGRVVMASSAAGLYGNFGQANYGEATRVCTFGFRAQRPPGRVQPCLSPMATHRRRTLACVTSLTPAARSLARPPSPPRLTAAMKMAMVGLTNTLAIEGARRNIAVNVVCPVASSRMTETVLPDELLSSLRPDLVAPIVAYLCHESCVDNGAVVECGGGWAGKLRRQRAKGVFFPAAQNPGAKGFEMEDVARAWKTICSYDDADYPETNQDVFGVIMEHVEAARASKL